MRRIYFFISLFLLSSNTFAITIDFESDAAGGVANGFTSADSAIAHFTDTSGADLQINNFANQSNGLGMIINSDDASALQIDFDSLVSNITLSFGNDDACCSAVGDIALLTLFNGAIQVGQVNVVMNRDDIMNQTISFAGAPFNRAVFVYANPGLTPINLSEIVDDIVFDVAVVGPPAAIPTMKKSMLIILAFLLFGLVFMNREKQLH